MSGGPDAAIEFALVPIVSLREHEATEPARVEEVRRDIERRGIVDEPILVSRGERVVLNGHHRFAALRALGAVRAPVYLVDYDHHHVELTRWGDGAPISKAEVVAMARSGDVYPPKTTRHTLRVALPHRPTPLAELFADTSPTVGARG